MKNGAGVCAVSPFLFSFITECYGQGIPGLGLSWEGWGGLGPEPSTRADKGPIKPGGEEHDSCLSKPGNL